MPVEVDEPRDQQRGVLGVGRQEGRLVDPQRGGSAEAGQVVDSRLAVVAHGGHRRVPAHSERAGHLGDRPADLADQTAHLGPGPLGERGPRRDLVHIFGPGLHWTVRVRAAPQSLPPDQHHRPVSHRQIADLHLPSAMADRSSAAHFTSHQVG